MFISYGFIAIRFINKLGFSNPYIIVISISPGQPLFIKRILFAHTTYTWPQKGHDCAGMRICGIIVVVVVQIDTDCEFYGCDQKSIITCVDTKAIHHTRMICFAQNL